MEGSGKSDMLVGAGVKGPQVSARVCVCLCIVYILFHTVSVFCFVFFQGPPGPPGPQGRKVMYL